MENLYDFSLQKLKSDSFDDVLKGKENVINVIVNYIRKEVELKHRNGISNADELIHKLNATINEILSTGRTILIDNVYLAFVAAFRELEAEEISGKDFELQKRAKEETKNVIQNELEKIIEYEKQKHKSQSLSPKLDQSNYFGGQKDVWYDANDQEIAEPTPEELQEYDKNGLHYIEIRAISPERELIVHHLGKEISIEQYAKMLPLGVNLGRNNNKTTLQNEQKTRQFDKLPNQLIGDTSDMDVFKPLLKRLKEINPLKEGSMRKMAKEFENMSQFMYMINRDIIKGKNIEELNRIKFEYEVNLRSALVHGQRGTLDYVVFEELLETICSTFQKAENDEVAQIVSDDMERLLMFLREEKENRLRKLAIEKPLKKPEGIPPEILTDMMTTYLGTDAITMTREEFLRMLEEREELVKEDNLDTIDTDNNEPKPTKYTPFTFPYERAIQLNGKYYITEGGKLISEDGKEYTKREDGSIVLNDDEQR